jgi:hypothetical protein
MKNALIFCVLLLTFSPAFAQQEKGDITVTFGGNYTKTKDMGMGTLFGKGGYFVTDNIEVGGKPTLFLAEGVTSFTMGLYGAYNFITSDAKLVPYAGAELVLNSVKIESLDGLSRTDFGIYGGSKYFLTEALNVDVGLNYTFNLSNNYGEGVDIGGTFTFQFGVGFIIGNLD